MSAIAGMIRFDDAPVGRSGLERAANALRAHGPDRTGVAINGNAGFAHVLMRMTPEDRFDHQPWCEPRRGAGGAMITADLRLDNRDDMLARLGVSAGDAASWPDSRIVLTAWERFGDAVWPMLRGPFAVAIFDPRERMLTLARDPVGLNVLMWHRNERLLAFATMPNGLFAMDVVSRVLNEEKFADFLVLNHADHATTIYKDVFRVPPAHVMRVTAEGRVTRHRFWSPHDIKTVRLRSDQDYADGLRDCLDRAVRRQLRSAYPVGCLLSGGLDSPSVAALAARALAEKNQRLAAFTGVPRPGFDAALPAGHYADETPLVEAIARQAGTIDLNYVRYDAGDDLAELDRFFIALEGPVRNPANLGWMLALLRLAREQGRRVLLGGLRGNHTISWSGWSQAADHLLRGRALTALRQYNLYYRSTSHSRWAALRHLFVEPMLPRWFGHTRGRRGNLDRPAPWREHSAIRPDFAAAMGVDARACLQGHDFRYRMRRDERVRGLLDIDYGGDWGAAEKAATGVELRDPTADLDVISYCFGVPPTQYLAEGIDRSLIRRAMWGLVPEQVLTSRKRGLQAADWHERLQPRRAEIAREIEAISRSPLAARAIDVSRLRRAVANWPDSGWHTPETFVEYNLALMRGVAGGRFLRWIEQAN